MATSWTQDDLNKLEKAMASGIQEVEYSTGKVKYRSLAEMQTARRLIRKALGLSKGIRRLNVKTSKGIG